VEGGGQKAKMSFQEKDTRGGDQFEKEEEREITVFDRGTDFHPTDSYTFRALLV